MANPANSTAYKGVDGRAWVDVTQDKTLALVDSGFVQNVIYDNATISVPATATQGRWFIRAGGVAASGGAPGTGSDGSMKLSVSPVAADQMQGFPDGSAVDNKDAILVKATMKVGDYLDVQNTGETNGPLVLGGRGVWSREA